MPRAEASLKAEGRGMSPRLAAVAAAAMRCPARGRSSWVRGWTAFRRRAGWCAAPRRQGRSR